MAADPQPVPPEHLPGGPARRDRRDQLLIASAVVIVVLLVALGVVVAQRDGVEVVAGAGTASPSAPPAPAAEASSPAAEPVGAPEAAPSAPAAASAAPPAPAPSPAPAPTVPDAAPAATATAATPEPAPGIPAATPTSDPQGQLLVDGRELAITSSCADADREVTQVTFGVEGYLELVATDPPVMTISSEGASATSQEVVVTFEPIPTYDATFPPGNDYGATTARLVINPQGLPPCG